MLIFVCAMFTEQHEWKIQAFLDCMKNVGEECTVSDVIAIGDSHIEIDAARHLFS